MKSGLTAVLLSLAFLACGGGGGGGGSSAPPASGIKNAGGIWYGLENDTHGNTYTTYAASSDQGYLVYYSGSTTGSLQLTGTDSDCGGSGPAFCSCGESGISTWKNGNITPYTSYNYKWNANEGDFDGTGSLAIDLLYDRPVAISSLAGTYTQNSSDGSLTNVTITGGGALSIDGYNGTISLIDPTKNLFSVSINSSSYTGLAWWSDDQSGNFQANSLYIIWVGSSGGVTTILTNTAGSVEILNNSGQNITGAWIAPHPETAWGSNMLTGTIANGASLSFANISPGNYDGQVQLADTSYKQSLNFTVSSGATTTFTVP